MSDGQIEVITSVERRRRWSVAEKERLVAALFEAGASVSALARSVGIRPSQLYGWRRQLCRRKWPQRRARRLRYMPSRRASRRAVAA